MVESINTCDNTKHQPQESSPKHPLGSLAVFEPRILGRILNYSPSVHHLPRKFSTRKQTMDFSMGTGTIGNGLTARSLASCGVSSMLGESQIATAFRVSDSAVRTRGTDRDRIDCAMAKSLKVCTGCHGQYSLL